ncbi:hypothetical protein LptCag_2197 [Leptospirillum ferriphilum]|uniref:Uncharacterized protein n=1 Tax=Leptospirillum ferriphilum TaxID=178606 RepID=A0A094WGI0_9BACT|nr:hypothetical protein LptCag_2197 [Leptospirillum ferriphilum]
MGKSVLGRFKVFLNFTFLSRSWKKVWGDDWTSVVKVRHIRIDWERSGD